MKTHLKPIILSLIFVSVFISSNICYADTSTENCDTDNIPIEVFIRDKCSHCHKEKDFFLELQLKRKDFSVKFHNIGINESRDLWDRLTNLENLSKVTPITLIGDTVIQGFASKDTTGKIIEKLIDKRKGKTNRSAEEFIKIGGSKEIIRLENDTCDEDTCLIPPNDEKEFSIPFLGLIKKNDYPLPVLSIILGFIDGFNPCAMWVLVTFIIVLMEVGSRKKMWRIAGIFIIAETIMYYLILNLWFTVWDFVGLDNIISPIVGLVAIGGGIFFLYEWKTSDGTCKVTNASKRANTTKKIKTLVNAEWSILTFLGILGLALSVNVIEFACSIGIPQTFTEILNLNNLSMLSKHMYMGIYTVFYMIDDLIVFGIAIYSMDKIGLTTKYSKISNLVGGILMLILGLILIINPSILVFN